ncbi:MAG: phospholipid carrier-dependent glycosyltransferase [Bdellovibrionales bacterium]|nr:phospholipid carrier-dependent glycosyltransferase [Bdellovibrionales bacterium]
MEPVRKKWLWGLAAASFALHFLGLTSPKQVIFDEFHFGKFVTAYCCTGQRFFDIHPPHAKLLIAGSAKAMGYKGQYRFSKIGENYNGPGLFGLRFLPALAGAMIPVLVYILLGQLGVTSAGAFMGGFALLLDNAVLVQSRFISLDTILVGTILGALVSLMAYMRAHSLARRSFFLTLSGTLAGLAIGTKFTGLVVLFILGLIIWRVANPLVRRHSVGFLKMISGVGVVALTDYAAGWFLHFHLLGLPGNGDRFFKPQGKFFQDTATTHQRMLASNVNLGKKHQDGSRWWQWPLMKNPIYYWANGGKRIYFLGNPVVWWGSSFFFVGLLCYLILAHFGLIAAPHPRQSARYLWIPLAAYFAAFAPYIFVNRVLFMYHYLTALVFGVVAVTTWLDSVGFFAQGGPAHQGKTYRVLLASVVLGFVLVSPLTFGFVSFGWHHSLLRFLFVVL